MNERISITDRKLEAKSQNLVPQIRRKTESSQSMNSPVDRILFLQRTIGNQAVGKLIKSGALQAKLSIGQPGDVYEQEADRVAEQVMRMPDVSEAKDTRIQRKCPKCLRGILGKDIKDEKLQAKEIRGRTPEVTSNMETNINALRGGGQPLPESTRSFYEQRFGRDFSQVLVHTDTKATEAARAVNARAFTLQKDVVFGEGQYSPETNKGRNLLAHELTHTIQQSSSNLIQCDAASAKSFKCPDFVGDAKLEACLNNIDRLRPGDRGPSVEKVQRGLMNDEIDIGPEGADSKFGANTAQGVMAFKTKHKLGFTQYPDAGPGTMSKLDELCGKGLPPATGCKFIVRYGNERRGVTCNPPGCFCSPNSCGGGIQFDILDIKAGGSACPPSLAGLKVTEDVVLDDGCMKLPKPITGEFTLDSKGKVPGGLSTDTIRICFPKRKVDEVMLSVGECTQTGTQKVFVGGMLADTRTIKFKILFRGDLSATDFLRCDAIVTRS